MVSLKSKKGILAWEGILVAVSIILTSLILIFIGITAYSMKSNFEEIGSVELQYSFPQAYVKTFLYYEITDEDKLLFFKNKDNYYNVADLIWLDTAESKDAVEKYKTKYQEKLLELDKTENNIYELYTQFSELDISNEKFLEIYLPKNYIQTDFTEEDKFNNYYLLRTKNNEDIFIFFIVPKSLSGRIY